MVFRDFKSKIIVRVIILTTLIASTLYLFFSDGKIVSAIIIGITAIISMIELIKFNTATNRKIIKFLEAVKYADFATNFTADNHLGESFKSLNAEFNKVLEAFRKARSEKEEHWQYLNTVIQHVNTGIITFDVKGNIELINHVAKGLLHRPQIRNISELEKYDKGLFSLLKKIKTGQRSLYQIDNRIQLVIHATELRLRGNSYKLVALQNIQSELQKKEIESWQNLTKVLRHEIMNSMTPIASLTSTLNDILREELENKGSHFEISVDGIDDIHEGLKTIESRSKALIHFIDAYREYTSIPQPKHETILVKDLLDDIYGLLKVDLRQSSTTMMCSTQPKRLTISADENQIKQVLINLVKNAVESVAEQENGEVKIIAGIDKRERTFIEVRDNGPGIIPEAIERIFIPFFTTKKTGSGIGLALSRQIMQLHNGTLTADSETDVETVFTMKF
jgi:nitrogen fixation/metabolism regulation signal transduction histidine kinase